MCRVGGCWQQVADLEGHHPASARIFTVGVDHGLGTAVLQALHHDVSGAQMIVDRRPAIINLPLSPSSLPKGVARLTTEFTRIDAGHHKSVLPEGAMIE